MGSRLRGAQVLIVVAASLAFGCRADDEAAAAELCARASALERTDPVGALRLQRKVWEEMPYTGTQAAERCGRALRERMGRARARVAHDERGGAEAVDGCAWTADAMEVFAGSVKPPYRPHWARRLAERCVRVVGRAWTRDPSNARYAELSARLKELGKKPEQD